MNSTRLRSVLRRLVYAVPFVRTSVHAVRAWNGRARPMSWVLEGHERDTGVPLRILFAGQLENKNYIADLAFREACQQRCLGRRSLWRLMPGESARLPHDADLSLVELPHGGYRLFGSGHGQWFIPCWVGGEVVFADAFERRQRSRNTKEDLRRMRKHEMTIEVTRDPAAFEAFYDQMYVPYVNAIFGDRVFLMSREEMHAALGHAELFLLRVRGAAVVGQIVLYEHDRVRAWSMGVKDGDRAHLKNGAMKALDYLLFQHLADRGHRAVHMGASRPFLRDGVLNYKKRLAMRLVDHEARGFALRVRAASPGAAAFLAGNPFIHVRGGQLHAALFCDPATLASEQARSELRAQHAIPGLAEVTLHPLAAGGGGSAAKQQSAGVPAPAGT